MHDMRYVLSSPALASYQVVVLKVSLHCKACAGKVKKHLSKMEGEPVS